jgi:hypothetical protein
MELEIPAGVTGRQGRITPPRHLIPPEVYPEVRFLPFSQMCISYRTYDIDHCSLFMLFHVLYDNRGVEYQGEVDPVLKTQELI